MRDAMHRSTPDSEHNQLLPEDEQQRRQLLRLLREHDAGRGVSLEASQSTFRIDLPDNPRRSNTLLPTPDSIYEAHSRTYTPISDRPGYPSMPQPTPHLPPNPVINQNIQIQPPGASFDPRPINMGSDYLVTGTDGVPQNTDLGKANTGYPNEKAEEAYGGARLLLSGELHPLQRERAQYHFETEEEQERRRRSASRENRRAEIEMDSRVTANRRTKIDGVVVTPRIARVETDGWGARAAADSR